MRAVRNPIAAAISFMIHIVVFSFVAVGLYWLNAQNDGATWWPWAVFGWGIGVAFHGLGLLASIVNFITGGVLRSGPFRGIVGLFWHWASYLIVIGSLAAMNLLTDTPSFWQYPALGWGFGLILHTVTTIVRMFTRGAFASRGI